MIQPKQVPLFFAFPDGVFHYVCAECDALCCRGQGMGGSLKREMSFLLNRYPALAPMANSRQRDLIDLSTPSGGCFFLRDDKLCQIEVEHGRSKKPGICIVFPFNRFHRLGDTVLVSPHFLCPLRVEVPARPGEVAGTHSILEAGIHESAMIEPKYADWYLKTPRVPAGEAKSILEREGRFRDECAVALGRQPFGDVIREHSEAPNELKQFLKRTLHLMAWGSMPPRSELPDSVDHVLLAIASSLRVDMLEASPERMLRFLALAEVVVRRVFGLTPAAPKPQAIYSVIQHAAPVLRLLSNGDDKVRVRRAKSAQFGQPDLVFAAFLTMRDIGSIGVLRALENGFKRLPLPHDRNVLASHVAEQVKGATVREEAKS